jgi:hypothetical protein
MKHTAIMVLTALSISPAWAADGAISASYSVAIKGVDVMKLRYSAEFSGSGYASGLNAKTTGMAKWLSSYKIDLTSEGAFAKNKFSPAKFSRERKKSGKRSGSSFAWSAGVPGIGAEDVAGPERVQKAVSTGATDPLAFLLQIGFSTADNPCQGKFRVFDGRDVMDTSISGAAGEAGTFKCKVTAKTIAGKSYEKADDKGNIIDVYEIVFKQTAAPFQGRNIFMPVEITGAASGQSFVATLEELNITGASTN